MKFLEVAQQWLPKNCPSIGEFQEAHKYELFHKARDNFAEALWPEILAVIEAANESDKHQSPYATRLTFMLSALESKAASFE